MAKQSFFGAILSKVQMLYKEITTYWKKPKEGEFVSYKELSYFVLGVSGSNSYTSLAGYFSFTAACLLIGSIYKIDFEHFYIIGLINMPIGLLMTPIYMLVQDNLGRMPKKSGRMINLICIVIGIIGIGCYCVPQHYFESILPGLPQILGTILTSSVFNVYFKIFTYRVLYKKFGKFRCWIVAGVIPTMIFLGLIIFIPFEKGIMPYYTKLWVLQMLFSYYGIFNVFSGQVGNIQNVISPSTEERTKIISFGSFLYSLAPSLVQMLLPVLASIYGSFNNIKVYRTVFPVLMVICAAATMILAFKVKDKIILEDEHKPQIGFLQGSKAVMKNKYFWITKVSALCNCITGGSVAVINIFFIYTTRQDWLMGIYAIIVGMSCIPGMLVAPWLIRKFGKKNLILLQKITSIISLAGSYLAISMGSTVLFILFNFISTLLGSPTSIASQAMTPDMWDYQQYLTGERLDGFSGIFDLIFTPISTVGAYLIPFLYAKFGFRSDWGLMYVPEIRNKIVLMTLYVGLIANAIGVIPYLFYDLTEKKHKEIMAILKQRLDDKQRESGLGENLSVEVAASDNSI